MKWIPLLLIGCCMVGFTLIGGCLLSSDPLNPYPSARDDPASTMILIKVTYEAPWSGAVSYAGNTKSIEGAGTTTFSIGKPGRFVSVNAQKGDKSRNRLTVEIIKGGKVIASEFTDASYGVASTSISL